MASIGQENLETVMIDFFGALRRGDFDAAAGLLDPGVSWQGLREEWFCHGREEVIDTFRWGLEQRREIDALEFTRGGEQVVLGARGPNIGPGGRAAGPDLQRLHPARRTDRPHRRLPGPRGGTRGSRRGRGRGLALIRRLKRTRSCRAGGPAEEGRAVRGSYSGGPSCTVPAPPCGRGRRGSRTPMSGSAGGSSSQELSTICSQRPRRNAISRLKRFCWRQRGLSIASIVAAERRVYRRFSCA
jgi:hypothetical protein